MAKRQKQESSVAELNETDVELAPSPAEVSLSPFAPDTNSIRGTCPHCQSEKVAATREANRMLYDGKTIVWTYIRCGDCGMTRSEREEIE